MLLFVKQASLIKETTESFQVLSGFGFPLHRFVPFKRMRRGRYAEFPPLTMILYQYIIIILTTSVNYIKYKCEPNLANEAFLGSFF